ncbi:MAG TPA: transcription-repair coupling factor [Bacteroidales bacterium]|nr:transcription-repair coupling factor [Bacteroidales bacterium]
MDIQQLLQHYREHPNLIQSAKVLSKPGTNVRMEGLTGSSTALILAGLFQQVNQTFLLVEDDEESAGYLYHDLQQLLGNDRVFFLPPSFKRSIKYRAEDPGNIILRTEVLQALSSDAACVVVTHPNGLLEKIMDAAEFKNQRLELHVGERLDTQFVVECLRSFEFERVDYVYEPGQYAVRGSLIDVYSWSHELPYRIDFFGDEVESIRTFDIENQLSKEQVERLTIVSFSQDKRNKRVSIFEHLNPANTFLGFHDQGYASAVLDGIEAIDDGYAVLDKAEFEQQIEAFRWIEYGSRSYRDTHVTLRFATSPQDVFGKNFDFVSQRFQEYIQQGYTLHLLSDSAKQIERLKQIFEDRGDEIRFEAVLKTLHEGFLDHDLKMACFTDHQIFERYHKYNLRSEKARNGKLALSLKELVQFEFGDYVVHIDYGVGRFGGLFRTEHQGKVQEVIKILYKDNDTLFVSIHNLHRISKYKGKEGSEPHIHKLGSASWQNLKEKTKKKVKDIARELIALYAARKEEQGFAFSPDSFLQQELEASFTYEDTPDQSKSTNDIKNDMERSLPMDRLVCGDVGFGKTEVAIRAAFKAVADNKQVAVLVPTTVLAFQHYKTFNKRLEKFPCRVDYLSRSRSAAQTKELLKQLKNGEIDILIGTHKLIGKQVEFKDLGLLIVDEEQKFGVSVKEKLRQIKVNVDTLTLTATPIPRTLQFSLMGARDLSIISTPPPNRYPIQTEVYTLNEELIREAVEFELGRSGQVLVVNNRIQNLGEIEQMIRRAVPGVRTVIAHGQMEGNKMEQILLDFMDYAYDVLISTSIIESGVDIPNANTILVNNAHQFGLSDLHQLRGRVGRSNRKAFCYLLAPPLNQLTPEARRRLEAIENFSDLGSGFNIAMQDLDIRGAGNMLGAEQSGFIADLGYETYQKILSEAVQELKDEEFSELYKDEHSQSKSGQTVFVTDCNVETDMEMMFPESYVPGASERMSLYREMDGLETESEIRQFEQRLQDRFGPIPEVAAALIEVIRLRRMAKYCGMEKVLLKNNQMICFFVSNAQSAFYQSEVFGKILDYAGKHLANTRLREANGKRSLLIENIENIHTALVQLELMQ